MKCLNCGTEYKEEYSFCPNCGTPAPIAEPVSLNPTADKVLAALKDNLFLVLCTLISISAAVQILAGGIPVIEILITIFLWITYSKSRNGEVDSTNLRRISGTVYAQYIINNVLFGILIGCGALISVIFAFIPNSSNIFEQFEDELLLELPKIASFSMEILFFIFKIIGPIIMIISIAGLLVNIYGMRKIHGFVKSIYTGVDFQNPNFENPNTAKNWMITFGVFQAIYALSNLLVDFFLAVSYSCNAAAFIIAAILVSKYFRNTEQKII